MKDIKDRKTAWPLHLTSHILYVIEGLYSTVEISLLIKKQIGNSSL